MDPMTAYGLMQGGGALLGYLGGRGEKKSMKKEYGSLKDMLMGQYNANPMDIETAMAHLRMGQKPRIDEYGKQLDRRYGWDSGRAAGGVAQAMFGGESEMYGNLLREKAQLEQQNKQNTMSTLAQLFASRYGGS